MAKKDDEFLQKLLAAFRIEAEEHLRAIANGLLDAEKDPTGSDKIIESMYREAHSLKGAARSVNMTRIEAVCQGVESIFAALKAGRIAASTELFDSLHRAANIMTELLEESDIEIQPVIDELAGIERGGVNVTQRVSKSPPKTEETAPKQEPDCSGIEASLEPVRDELPAAHDDSRLQDEQPEMSDFSGTGKRKERYIPTETVRIAVSKLDPLLRQVGEMVSVKLTSSQRVSDLLSVVAAIDQWKQKWGNVSSQEKVIGSILTQKRKGNGSARKEADLAKITDFLEWNQSCMKNLEHKIRELVKSAEGDARLHGSMVDDLLDDMMNVLMLPCSSLLEIFPKLVRDLSRDAGKEVRLEILGADLEIDRRILEEMKDPLIHLVRNCIDHGIELPNERVQKGKLRYGTITIAISQISGNQIELLVSDDGAGIDEIKVREAAKRRGMISEQEKVGLEGQDAVALVFRSEVSTSPIVSNISGRGLGLAIVREKVENLGGNISVATAHQRGVSFRILLPVTLATFRGILVKANDQLFVIPTANVERVIRVNRDSVRTVGNRDTIDVNGKTMPFVGLGDALELPRVVRKGDDGELALALVLRSGETLVGFRVDAILHEQEVLVKGLGKQLSRVKNVAGATVLGDGSLAPILNVQDLVKSATRHAASRVGPAVKLEELDSGNRSILVVEDSITSRMLLKNILESSGYQVTTTIDGMEAWNLLKQENFDLVVSDVEMPRMDGFELTTTIRQDEKLSGLPVVLVTSLGSREDRERGIDVGASAYIVKGSFDQNNLLETVERLI
jgi:two-component system chemotaxis sensor kinase CheA